MCFPYDDAFEIYSRKEAQMRLDFEENWRRKTGINYQLLPFYNDMSLLTNCYPRKFNDGDLVCIEIGLETTIGTVDDFDYNNNKYLVSVSYHGKLWIDAKYVADRLCDLPHFKNKNMKFNIGDKVYIRSKYDNGFATIIAHSAHNRKYIIRNTMSVDFRVDADDVYESIAAYEKEQTEKLAESKVPFQGASADCGRLVTYSRDYVLKKLKEIELEYSGGKGAAVLWDLMLKKFS